MKNFLIFSTVLCCLLMANNAVVAQASHLKVTDEEANVQLPNEQPQTYLVEISGPENYYWNGRYEDVKEIKLSNLDKNGKVFPDGLYRLQILPEFRLTDEQLKDLSGLREKNDEAAMAEYRRSNNLPEKVEVLGVNFSIRNGKFVNPDLKESKLNLPSRPSSLGPNHPALYASLDVKELDFPDRAMDLSAVNEDDAQVFAQDVVIQGSLCIGIDCNSAENFGADTERFKENNLRIHFEDTSNSGSFPTNDWRIVINDSDNGGRSYFGVEDATAGRFPFQIEAGAPANSLVVESDGDIGIGTLDPVLEIHVADGDSPALRLEQNNSSGFTPQTWDVAGNETNFFVRDVTNGSQLPFKIRPGADDNSLVISNDNNIGIGVLSPTHRLQVESGNVYVKSGKVGINVNPTAFALDVAGTTRLVGTTVLQGDVSNIMTNGVSFIKGVNTIMRLDGINGRVGIGTAAPQHQLQLSQDDAFKPNGGSWLGASDRRLKTNIHDFTDGLETVLKINPVKFHYNGKLNLPTDQEYVGVIAQDMQVLAPYTVKKLKTDSDKDDYLAYDGTAVTYLLVNAVKEQQKLIESQQKDIEKLQKELAEMNGLKAAVAELKQMVEGKLGAVNADSKASNSADE